MGRFWGWVILLIMVSGEASAFRQGPDTAESGLVWESQTSQRKAVTLSPALPSSMEPAWQRFQDRYGSKWKVLWDEATLVPSRIYGQGIPAPGSTEDALVAQVFAERFLGDTIALIAPGGDVRDFKLVSNQLHRGIRTLGYMQTHQGLLVRGGQVSFRFKNDRLFVIASEALPRVEIARAQNEISALVANASIRSWATSNAIAMSSTPAAGEPLILPHLGHRRVVGYHHVQAWTFDASAPSARYRVFVDAQSGKVLATEQLLQYADASISLRAPIRGPEGERRLYPGRDLDVVANEESSTTNDEGVFSWSTNDATDADISLQGPLVRVSNQSGAAAIDTFRVVPDESLIWDASEEEFVDAQITGYVHARIVKEYAKTLNPGLGFLDEQQEVNVNIGESCNAFSDGESINFFIANDQCENTGRLADVVYHEFGHSLHAHSILNGSGSFDGAFSEGLSDYLAATITGDPAMGIGFFKNNAPLRHLDPVNREHVWPDDIGEIHYTGLIFGGAMWDLRKRMVEVYGEIAGVRIADRLYYGAVQRASNIPATYVEILAEDDDDGDLSNGTPNLCNISEAFGAHGLRDFNAQVTTADVALPSRNGHEVTLRVSGLFEQCPGDRVDSAIVEWRAGPDSEGDIVMNESGANVFVASLPTVESGGTIEYRVTVRFADGSSRTFPENPADPDYQLFIGEVVPLYCTDFDTDPFEEGWSHGLSGGEDVPGADDWMWGQPAGAPGSGDPALAFTGESVVGNDLGGDDFDGLYQAQKGNWLESPEIDVGQYSDVRIQYRRWLNVEDGFFDQARIRVNGQNVWSNLNSDNGDSSSVHHRDKSWRFHDVPISDAIESDSVKVRFSIQSDGGLEFGGWTIDDFCVVAIADQICGDGVVRGRETCDEGDSNSDTDPDACRLNCAAASCGDGVRDLGEDCDDGNTIDGDACPANCIDETLDSAGCGCRSSDGTSPALLVLALLSLVFVATRRRLPLP